MKNIKFALLQLTCSEDVQANQQKTEAKIREAAAQGAQVICLQELYRSVYFCHKQDAAYFDLAEVISEDYSNLGWNAVQTLILVFGCVFFFIGINNLKPSCSNP